MIKGVQHEKTTSRVLLIPASITPVALVIADLPAMIVRCEVTRKRATVTHQIY